ncbi:MAG: peptidylprolyl isomerase [Peptoniphilaceae bacterium]|nr:peptidylprolyl isomerase [Peptoniphilaceae bacterium]MDY3075910.1 peptidylprolyl isomerase [Peptoniphilaceae bacterium]
MFNKKNTTKWMSLGLASMLLLSGCGASGTYATVNGEKITKAAYEEQIELYKDMIAAQYQLSTQVKDQLVKQVLMQQELEKNGIKITKDDYQKDYDAMVTNYGGATAYAATLKKIGITDEQMKQSLHFQTVLRMHQKWYNDNHTPSDDDMQKYYNDNKDNLMTVQASHILVSSEDEAKKVIERINGGEKFEDIAKEVSLDGSAANGGSLGEATPSKYAPEFAQAVKTLPIGQISDPVKTQFGYHVIRVDSRKESFDDLKETIIQQLNQQAYATYLNELVANAEVKVEGESTAAPAASSQTQSNDSQAASESSKASESAPTIPEKSQESKAQ